MSWWLPYRCFIAVCKCCSVLKLQCKKMLLISRETWGDGVPKYFLGWLLLAIFYAPLINYDIIRALPQNYSAGEGCPSPHSPPSRRLRRLELIPPTFQTKDTPLSGCDCEAQAYKWITSCSSAFRTYITWERKKQTAPTFSKGGISTFHGGKST